MTNQAPEVLVVEAGAIELPSMSLYGIFVGNPDDPKSWMRYQFSNTGDKAKMRMSTALYRGYISTYRLRVDGTLALEAFEYPLSKGAQPDKVYEVLQGDFWIDLRESFRGDGFRIPFFDGKVTANQSQWRRREGYDMDRLLRDVDAKNCVPLTVTADKSLAHGMQGYKVYLNGNIQATPQRFSHLEPANGIYTRIAPGLYRAIVREADHSKPGRAESNTLNVEARQDSALALRLSLNGDKLKLVGPVAVTDRGPLFG